MILGKDEKPTEVVQSLRIKNSHRAAILVILEPQGSEYSLPPGETLELREDGNIAPIPLEIHYEPGQLIVFGRVGGILRAIKDGKELL